MGGGWISNEIAHGTSHLKSHTLCVIVYVQHTDVRIYVELSNNKAIEGFHDAVRTLYVLRPGRHVGFFWNNKICFNFVSILFEKIKLTVSERTYIIVPMV